MIVLTMVNVSSADSFDYLKGNAGDYIFPKPGVLVSSNNSRSCILLSLNSTLEFDGEWTLAQRLVIRNFYHRLLPTITPTEFRPAFKAMPAPRLNVVMGPQVDTEGNYNNTIPFGPNEGYDIYATSGYIRIVAPSTFGAMNAFKSLSQISYVDVDHTLCVTFLPLTISDVPTYRYRGLMIDTGRYYFDMDFIKSTIRGISMLKLNVMHWHITDDQSFPIEIAEYPYIHVKGAGHLGFIHNNVTAPKSRFYTVAEMNEIVAYANDFGVRIIPEIDMPAHARSWGLWYNITTNCPAWMFPQFQTISYGYTINQPLDISLELTYEIIGAILRTVGNIFPDPYVHLGGDEVPLPCWGEDMALRKRMARLGYPDPSKYLGYFFSRMFPLAKEILPTKKFILWEDTLPEFVNDQVLADNDIIFQVWKGTTELHTIEELEKNFIYSFGHYLDPSYQRCKTFNDCYSGSFTFNPDKLIGVESCAWEMTQGIAHSVEKDGTTVERGFPERVWHRLIALSEKLWSGPGNVLDDTTIKRAVRIAKTLEGQDIEIGSTIHRIKNYDKEYN
eukprot:gene7852-9214_t